MRAQEFIFEYTEGWKEAEELNIQLSDGWIGVENTPDGVLIYGDDVRFNDDNAWLEFIYNLTTGKLVSSKVHHGYNGDYDFDWDEAQNAIDDIADEVKKRYGSTWEEISDELHGGLEVEEGWKDWVAGAAMGAAALGGAGNADAAIKKDLNKPAIQQVVKKKEIKPVAPPAASKKELSKTVTGNPHEVYLRKVAEKNGIQGQELIAFMSQAAHETLDFKSLKEFGGKLDFKKYDPRFAPRKAKELGNTKPGDGAKYKGRGYMQITGKWNYEQAGKALGLDLVNHPELLEKPEYAAKAAVWYWKTRVANKVNSFKNTQDVTKQINPGLKHLDKRMDKQKAFQVAMK